MPVITLPIANGTYQSDSLPISNQQCTNFYPNIVQTQGLSQETLFGTPGKSELTNTGAIKQINRGALTFNDEPYFVNGTTLYRVERTVVDDVETFTNVAIGPITGTERVWMAKNPTQLMIVADGTGWIWDGTFLTEIADADFKANGTPLTVVFINSRFVVTTDQKKFIFCAPNDGTDWNALDFVSAEIDPDAIVAPHVFSNQLFMLGTETIQVFDTTGTGRVFLSNQGFVIPKGLFAQHSVIASDKTFMFIGGGKNESPAIWEFTGNNVEKVSTTAIDSLLQGFTQQEIADSFAMSYAQKGGYFVIFSLPTTAMCFDTVTRRWHERKSQITDTLGVTQTVRWRVNSLVTAFGRVLAGDSIDGRIGDLSPTIFTEYGREIIRTLVTPPFHNQGQSLQVSKLELTVESGVGDATTPNPQVRMSRSKDGKTFSDEKSRSIGKIGRFNQRVIWRRLGRVPRFELFKFVQSDPVKPAFLRLEATIIGGVGGA